MVLTVVLFLIGLALLYFGAEWLVGGASAIALRFGIAPLIVGLTVVAFGTSAPELLVSLLAVFDGKDGISIGNIVGSNIANIALILGVSALIRPVEVSKQVLMRDYPVMLLASVLLLALSYDGVVERWEGGVLFAGIVAYIGYSLYRALKGGGAEEGAEELEGVDTSKMGFNLLKVFAGIAGLAGGAYLLVESAVVIAKSLNVPDLVIGITVVAVGTSLPELATSVMAAIKGESDISVGNVVGSNIFNILLVLGLVAMILPMKIADPGKLLIDLGVMVGVAVISWPIMRTGLRINRAEGAFFLVGYVVYMVVVFMG